MRALLNNYLVYFLVGNISKSNGTAPLSFWRFSLGSCKLRWPKGEMHVCTPHAAIFAIRCRKSGNFMCFKLWMYVFQTLHLLEQRNCPREGYCCGNARLYVLRAS